MQDIPEEKLPAGFKTICRRGPRGPAPQPANNVNEGWGKVRGFTTGSRMGAGRGAGS